MKTHFTALLILLSALTARGEVILQYFGTSWVEIERRLPELVEAGYSALWLPPPFKGSSGGFSVGYDPVDRFDIGTKDQSGSLPTKYGSGEDLKRLVEVAHRMGMRVYFDNVMAHTAGPLDPVPAGTLLPGVPGFVPEDMHLGWNGTNWQKFADFPDWLDEWQVLNRNPFAWDIAQEDPNTSFDDDGLVENADFPKWVGVRHPGQPEIYLDLDLTVATNGQGNAVHPFANKEPFEDVGLDGLPNTGDLGEGNGVFDFTDTDGDGQHDAGEGSEPFTDSGVDGSNPDRQTVTWGYGDGIYNMGDVVAEDVNSMLFRAVRWFVDEVKPDGFRLDAVKHVPSYFFGQQSGADKDYSNAGYNGSIQEHFNAVRGYSDWGNHRDSLFNADAARDDALLFGEHLGAPPALDGYLNAGMRVAGDQMANAIQNSIGDDLSGLDQGGFGHSFGNAALSMSYVMSHDNNYLFGGDRAMALPWMVLKEGIPIVYTDGFNQAGAPDYFPKPAEVNFLGQFADSSLVGAVSLSRDFIRGSGQTGRWSDEDFLAFERFDFSEQGPAAGGWNAPTLLVMMARNYIGGAHGRGAMTTGFPAGAALVNYAPTGGDFVAVVQGDGTVRDEGGNVILVPSGQYFAFAWRRPELPLVWGNGSVDGPAAIEIYEDGVRAGTMTVTRRDGVDGDPDFNPYGLGGQIGGDYSYEVEVPRVTSGGDMTFVARADGSAENVYLKLDGGMDVNSQLGIGPTTGAKRDFPPGRNDDLRDDQGDGDLANDTVKHSSTDVYLGYEQMAFVGRWNEKFAATDVGRNVTGSLGAETWSFEVGTAGVNRVDGAGVNSFHETATWLYHDPAADNQLGTGDLQLLPAPESADGAAMTVWVKVGYENQVDEVYLYYTTDGSAPEGSGGVGKDATEVVSLTNAQAGSVDGGQTSRWWTGVIPAQAAGTVVTYKIGGHRNVVGSRFPFSTGDHGEIARMETVFEVTGFDATSVMYHPHNDYGEMKMGLEEGWHVVRSKPFVGRSDGSSISKVNTQVFYYDVERPDGVIPFPAENDSIGGSSYEFVVLTDAQVTEVRFNIGDGFAGNDGLGNGSWASATLQGASAFLRDSGWAKEWRFEYTDIPISGSASVQVRLMEESSSSDMNLTDEQGWYTTLTRTVATGVGRTWSIVQPLDEAVVGDGDVMRVHVSKELVGALSDAQFLSEVRILVASQVSGQSTGAALQPLNSYTLVRDVNGSEHAVEFVFSNLFNGEADFLHHVRAIHLRGGQTLSDTVLVKMQPGRLADADNDCLPDQWEGENGLQANNPFGIHGADGDYDLDGLTNKEEYIFGLDPRTADAQLAPDVTLTLVSGGWDVGFPGIPGRLHTLYWSSDLEMWNPLVEDLETEEAMQFEILDDSGATRRFYRAEYELKY